MYELQSVITRRYGESRLFDISFSICFIVIGICNVNIYSADEDISYIFTVSSYITPVDDGENPFSSGGRSGALF